MPKKQDKDLAQKIATAASFFVWTFIIFCGGLYAAHTDMLQRIIKDFTSGVAQAEMLPYAKAPFDKQLTVWKDAPHALQGGALLIGSHYSVNPALLLVDEEGNILHRWHVENKLFNLDIQRWWNEPVKTRIFAIDDAHLLPGGDVIFTQDLRELQNFRGQRLARMDADSHIKWQVPGAFHHEFDIAGTPQHIYAMASVMRDELPVIGPALDNVRYLEDVIYEYTLDGEKVDSWSVPEAFANSPYRNMLTLFEIDIPDLQKVKAPDGTKRVLYDLIHLNSIQYLDATHAKAIPQAQAGDLLISLRGLNALAVLRPSTKQIVWAKLGPWRHQHSARVEEDGKLYVYDNEGSIVIAENSRGDPKEQLQSRVLHYDAFNGMWDVVYASTRLHSYWRGYYYFLPGGYTIISSAQQSRVVVLSPEKTVIWELRGVPSRDLEVVPYQKQISTIRYYPADKISFFTTEGKKQ